MQLHRRTRHYETVCLSLSSCLDLSCVGGLQDLSCYGFIESFRVSATDRDFQRLSSGSPQTGPA